MSSNDAADEGCKEKLQPAETGADTLVSITVEGSTHTRTAAEWLALARADLRAKSSSPREVDGTWARDDPRRAFVEGMKWWQFKHNGSSAFASEIDDAEAEAQRRFAVSATQRSDIAREIELAYLDGFVDGCSCYSESAKPFVYSDAAWADSDSKKRANAMLAAIDGGNHREGQDG